MITFLIQNDSEANPENHIVEDIIKRYNMFNSINTITISYKDFKEQILTVDYSKHIPIGTISFVNTWLTKYHNTTMFSLEVPKCLQSECFLGRSYEILKKSELPKTGRYFIKNLDQLKSGTFVGDMYRWWLTYSNDYEENSSFVISSEIEILSEWRVYVVRGEILNISNYDGNPTIFPDMNLIQRAKQLCDTSTYTPKSYTLDVVVTPTGTVVLEVHPFSCIGLYSTLWDDKLLDGYEDGIKFYTE